METGMPIAAATTSDRLRPVPGTSGASEAAPACTTDESETTVTLEASSEVAARAIGEGRGRP